MCATSAWYECINESTEQQGLTISVHMIKKVFFYKTVIHQTKNKQSQSSGQHYEIIILLFLFIAVTYTPSQHTTWEGITLIVKNCAKR